MKELARGAGRRGGRRNRRRRQKSGGLATAKGKKYVKARCGDEARANPAGVEEVYCAT